MRLYLEGCSYWRGKMGRWFTRLFKGEGYSVVVSSRTRSKAEALRDEFGVEVADNYVEAVQGADWILLCVSLDGLEPVLKEIGSHVRSGQVVMDIGSVKEVPVQLLHKYVEKGLRWALILFLVPVPKVWGDRILF